jgi:hypothetical protein
MTVLSLVGRERELRESTTWTTPARLRSKEGEHGEDAAVVAGGGG